MCYSTSIVFRVSRIFTEFRADVTRVSVGNWVCNECLIKLHIYRNEKTEVHRKRLKTKFTASSFSCLLLHTHLFLLQPFPRHLPSSLHILPVNTNDITIYNRHSKNRDHIQLHDRNHQIKATSAAEIEMQI